MDVVADRFELFLGIAAVEGFVDGLFFIDGVLVFLSLIPVPSMHPRRSRITLSRIRDARWAVIFWQAWSVCIELHRYPSCRS